jgi:DNA-directed RNA polymerase specialized sigma24 family protein
MTLEEELRSNDMPAIIDSMTAYVYGKIKTIGVNDLEGKDPADFVAEVLKKVAEGTRNWEKATCPFKEFLFGCLRSDLNNFFKSFEQIYEAELTDDMAKNEASSNSELKDIAIIILQEDGANDEEVEVFGCWIDGVHKPREIAEQLKKDVKAIYNIIKRLERRMPILKSQIKKFV